MKISLTDWNDGTKYGYLVDKTIKPKDIVEKVPLKPKSTIRASRIGRTVQIKFKGNLSGQEMLGILSFNQDEILQLAKLLRRERDDVQFLQAIERAGL